MNIRNLAVTITAAAAAAIAGIALSLPAGAAPAAFRQPNPQPTHTRSSPSPSPTPTPSPSPSPTPSPSPSPSTTGAGPVTGLHYTPNGVWSSSGAYEPGALGFNLADVTGFWAMAYLPAGVQALVWLGDCGGATASFQSQVQPYLGNSKVWGFYLMDEPNPSSCPVADLKAESDWIHANDPGAKTFIIEENLSASYHPSYVGGYTPANSDIDYYGLDPYPCRNDTYPVPLNGCNYNYITLAVTAAEQAGIPQADIVPVYQAFGGGTSTDDGNGTYILPSAAQEQQILSTWGGLIANPVFDYAYSWGVQNSDTALSDAPASLQQVFAAHNG